MTRVTILSKIAALLLLLSLAATLPFQIRPVGATAEITIPVGLLPLGVSFDSSNGIVYVANSIVGTNRYPPPWPLSTVSAIDASSNSVVSTITTGNNSRAIAVDPLTNKLFVANAWSDTVSVIDATRNKVVYTIPIGLTPNCTGFCTGNPELIAVNPSTDLVYAVNAGAGNTSVINGATYKVVATLPVGANPGGIVVDPTTNTVIMAGTPPGGGDPSVFFIDGSNNSIRSTILMCLHIGNCMGGLALDTARHRLYVTSYDPPRVPASLVSVIDTSTYRILQNISVGDHPEGVAVDPLTNFVFVADGSNYVSVINASDYSVYSTLTVGFNPQGVDVDTATGMVYVANYFDNTVTAFQGPGTPQPIIVTTTQFLPTTTTQFVSTTLTSVTSLTSESTITVKTTTSYTQTVTAESTIGATTTAWYTRTVESPANPGYVTVAIVSIGLALVAISYSTISTRGRRGR